MDDNRDINKRLDKLEDKIDRLSDKLAESQRDIRDLERRNGLLTSAVVSAFVTAVCWILVTLLKGQ